MATIKTNMIKIVNEHAEQNARIKKAQAYSAKCAKKRKTKNAIYDVLVFSSILLFSVGTYGVCKWGHNVSAQIPTVETETTTEMTLETEITTEPLEKHEWCMVTEVMNDLVAVEYKGNSYGFYGDGFKVGNEVKCEFQYNLETHEWEITDVLSVKPTEKVEAVLVGIDEETGAYEIQLENGEIKTVPDAPEVWYTVELDANGNVIGIEE